MNEREVVDVVSSEIVPRGELPAIADDHLIEIARKAEERLDAIKKIKAVALKVTNRHDWTDQGGKPYPQVSGSEKVARLFGISWRIFAPQKTRLEGEHYRYTYKGEFSLGGVTIEAIGTRSSNDDFFAKRSQWEGNQKKVIFLPGSEINEGNVEKAALTNCLGNGITRILGIRNLTWEEVEQFSGVKRTDVSRIEYKKGAGTKPAGGSPPQGSSQKPAPGDAAQEPENRVCPADSGKSTGGTRVAKKYCQHECDQFSSCDTWLEQPPDDLPL